MITLDTIRTIYKGGEYDAEGNVIVAPTPLTGFHVNVSRLLPEIEAFAITPEHPTRMFAGAPTFFLRFADEAEYIATFFDKITTTDEEGNVSDVLDEDGRPVYNLKPFVTAPLPKVPVAISRAQGKAVLMSMGMWDGVVAYVAAIADPMQKAIAEVALNDTQEWRRDSEFLKTAATALGLSKDQLDDLFIQASGISF